jgi:uncharacterized membrane protein
MKDKDFRICASESLAQVCRLFASAFFCRGRVLNGNVNESGSVTVLIVAFLPVVLLLMGWSIDVGRVLAAKTELYKAGDIAAREMAYRIDMQAATTDGTQNRVLDDTAARVVVEANLDGLDGGALDSVSIRDNGANVEVTCKAKIPLLFCGLIGRTSETISATGMGRIKTFVSGGRH